MEKKTTNIDAGTIDKSRPADRPPKTNWKLELIKKGLRIVQHISPTIASKVIWHFLPCQIDRRLPIISNN